jgi:hypothetical protein
MKVSRRKFLAGSAATAAGAAVATSGISLLSERAEAFFNMGAFWKKPVGSGQTSNGYTIGQSLRFNLANSTFLSRTVSVGGNQQTWTLSMWVKRTALTIANDFIFGVSLSGADNFGIRFGSSGNANDSLDIYSQFDNEFGAKSVQLFRDPSAWGHLVLAMDVTQSTNANKIKIYWNGVQITSLTADESFAGPYPTATTAMQPNAASTVMYLGKRGSGAAVYTSCYLAEFCWVDGQQLSPTSFGQVDTNSGQWIPKAPSVSDYGKNGCYLNFSNSSSLGADSAPISGNHTSANNWTPTNFQVYDQVLDSPTNNFCTWNPAVSSINNSGGATAEYSNGNLTCKTYRGPTGGGSPNNAIGSIALPSTGKYIAQIHVDFMSSSAWVGVAGPDYLWKSGYVFWNTSGIIDSNRGTSVGASLTYGAGDYLYIAVDQTNDKYWFGKKVGSSITWLGGGDPASGTTPTTTGAAVAFTGPVSFLASTQAYSSNTTFTIEPDPNKFQVTAPAGFKALCTANLSTPTIKKSSQYFSAVTYTGNGGFTSNRIPVMTSDTAPSGVAAAIREDIFPAWHAFDGIVGYGQQSWQTNSTSVPAWISYDFGSGQAKTITQYVIYPAVNGGNASPTAWSFQGSNDNSAWATLDSRSGQSLTNGSTGYPFAFSNSTAYRYYRLYITSIYAGSTAIVINELQMMETLGAAMTISGLNFQPDLVWIKSRSVAASSAIFDSVRGSAKYLSSDPVNTSSVQTTDTNSLTAFNSNGFAIGNASILNTSAATYVAWSWKKGLTPGFDIATFTAQSSAPYTFSHNLGAVPQFMLLHATTTWSTWEVYHQNMNSSGNAYLGRLLLNSSAAYTTTSASWNNTAPTQDTVTLGSDWAGSFGMVAYLWTEVAGFSKFGSYIGNGNADGPFVYTGFRPAFVLIKNVSTTTDWNLFDSARNTYNGLGIYTAVDLSSSEYNNYIVDFVANGFKVRNGTGGVNNSAQTYIFAAFAEAPFKYANAR